MAPVISQAQAQRRVPIQDQAQQLRPKMDRPPLKMATTTRLVIKAVLVIAKMIVLSTLIKQERIALKTS